MVVVVALVVLVVVIVAVVVLLVIVVLVVEVAVVVLVVPAGAWRTFLARGDAGGPEPGLGGGPESREQFGILACLANLWEVEDYLVAVLANQESHLDGRTSTLTR